MGVASQVMLLITCLLAIYVGGRTLWIAARTRGAAELAIGVNVISVAIGAAILTVTGVISRTNPDAYDTVGYKTGIVFLALHLFAIYFGTWKIFHPRRRWLLVPLSLVLALIGSWTWLAMEHLGSVWLRPVLFQALRGVGMTWSAFECFHYSDLLRRRAALGLADPMMAHRFWLWAVGATSALIVCTFELMGFGMAAGSFSAPPVGLLMEAALGLVGTICVALAFFPPEVYERRLRARLEDRSRRERAAERESG